MSSKQNPNQKDLHERLNRQHKNAITILAMLVLSQFLFAIYVADAGELTVNNLFECTNAIRAEHGVPPLYLNDKLNLASSNKLDDMANYGYWAHQNPVSGKKPWDFVDEAGYYYKASGENLAFGFTDSQAVCDSWRASKTHLANIINPDYQEIGFAVDKANLHKNGKGLLVVQIFGSREDFTPPGTDPGSLTNQQNHPAPLSTNDTNSALATEPREQNPGNMVLGLQSADATSHDLIKIIYLLSILTAFILGRIMIRLFAKKIEPGNRNIHKHIGTVLAFVCAFGAILIIFIP